MIRKIFVSIGIIALAAIVLFLGNIGYHRLRGPSAEQRAAMDALQRALDAPARGRNAFALMWLGRLDVADDEIEAHAERDVQAAAAQVASTGDVGALPSTSLPRLAEPRNNEPGLCQARDSKCIARVRADRQATLDVLAQHPGWLRRAAMLETMDSYRNEFPVTLSAPMWRPGPTQRLRLSELALQFADGAHADALASVCRNIDAWRRQRHDTNSLLFSMAALAHVDDGLRLFAEMWAESASLVTVPDACRQALAPIEPADVVLCPALAGEWELARSTIARIAATRGASTDEADSEAVLFPLFFSTEQATAWQAQQLAADCTDAAGRDALADRIAATPARISRVECAASVTGCILAGVAAPAYDTYRMRALDGAAHLRLAATLIWLREHADGVRLSGDRLAQLPAELRSGNRAIGIDDDTRTIHVENLDSSREARFELPMPELHTGG